MNMWTVTFPELVGGNAVRMYLATSTDIVGLFEKALFAEYM